MQSMHDAPFNVGQVAIERPASGQMPCGACMLHRAYVLHKTAELDQMPDLGADSRAQLVQELEDNAFDPSTGPGGMRKRSAVSHSWRMPFQMQGRFSASAQKR